MSEISYTAVVPVAGTGTRLRPHTYTYPKVMLTVGDKPIIGHIIDRLSAAGIKKIVLVTGYLGSKIRTYVNKNYADLNITYVEQTEQKGLGHAIWLTRSNVTGPMLVMLGDTIIDADLSRFTGSQDDCIAVKEVADPRRFGVVETKDGYISAMVEKPEHPKTNLAIVGIYSFRKSESLYAALQSIVDSGTTTKGEIQFTDAMALMVKNGHKIKPVAIDGWYDCGKAETLLQTNRFILSLKKFAPERKGCLIVPPVYIADTAEVENSIIGPNVSVGSGAKISGTIISDSIINDHAVIKDMNLDGTLIGPGAVVKGFRNRLNVGENSEIAL
ncbi:MAG: NTP transferase domain-containing protein [Elusimicrobiales bacterium]|jgi:glucose-1-phosphate thymidylyltransferase|nr:NTP transferase domain-containing protein [Elusimicrobiales bacterium]